MYIDKKGTIYFPAIFKCLFPEAIQKMIRKIIWKCTISLFPPAQFTIVLLKNFFLKKIAQAEIKFIQFPLQPAKKSFGLKMKDGNYYK